MVARRKAGSWSLIEDFDRNKGRTKDVNRSSKIYGLVYVSPNLYIFVGLVFRADIVANIRVSLALLKVRALQPV